MANKTTASYIPPNAATGEPGQGLAPGNNGTSVGYTSTKVSKRYCVAKTQNVGSGCTAPLGSTVYSETPGLILGYANVEADTTQLAPTS